ncbi:ankyrin repeat domain-containing protein [Streptomyces sp. NPDC048383]|uniref:ankyrin repeat domain-containing protein n=1 Tax=Streptomyces sp. NPDC048383 TaxID=3155386 RepID=UPI0034457A38
MTDSACTPMHQAVESGDQAGLTRILDEGADPNEVCCGMTLLMHAIDVEGDTALRAGVTADSRSTVILLAYGAEPLAQPRPHLMGAVDLADHYGHDIAYRLLNRLIEAKSAGGRPQNKLRGWRRNRRD